MRRIRNKWFEVAVAKNKTTSKFRLRLGGAWLFISLVKQPDKYTIGIANETRDGRYVPFVDYDDVDYDKVNAEAKMAIKGLKLSGLALIATREKESALGIRHGSYHLIGIDKLPFHTHYTMLEGMSCDRNFLRAVDYYRERVWVLRVYPKIGMEKWKAVRERPELLEWISGKGDGKWERSLGIYNFLRDWYGIPEIRGKFDGIDGVRVESYTTGA